MIINNKLDMKNVIYECFSTDQELIDEYHVEAGTDLDTCVDRTFKDLLTIKDLKFNTIIEDGKICGFFGVHDLGNITSMAGYFLKNEYRNKESVLHFWRLVEKTINKKEFLVGVYKKNTRAVRFLKKKSSNFVEYNEGLIFKIESDICHFL